VQACLWPGASAALLLPPLASIGASTMEARRIVSWGALPSSSVKAWVLLKAHLPAVALEHTMCLSSLGASALLCFGMMFDLLALRCIISGTYRCFTSRHKGLRILALGYWIPVLVAGSIWAGCFAVQIPPASIVWMSNALELRRRVRGLPSASAAMLSRSPAEMLLNLGALPLALWLCASWSNLCAIRRGHGTLSGHCGNTDRSSHMSIEFTIVLDRSTGVKLGVDVDQQDGEALGVESIKDGLIRQWNETHPDKRVRRGDRIIDVNGVRSDVLRIVEECKQCRELQMTIRRWESK